MNHSTPIALRTALLPLSAYFLGTLAVIGFGGWKLGASAGAGGWFVLGAGAVLALGGILAIVVGGNRALGRLEAIRDVLRRIANGDLGARAAVGGRIVEFEDVARCVNGMGEANGALVQELRDGAQALEREVKAFQDAFGGMRRQADRSREASATVAAAMEELGAGVGVIGREADEVSATANEACDLSRRLHEMSQDTSTVIGRQFQGIQAAGQRLELATTSTQELERRGEEIAGMASAITDVAKRLRLLALNASIEAVKAGDKGRGFSVVAQEVKDLADQAGDMAARIQGQVEAVAKGTRRVASDMVHSGQAMKELHHEGERSVVTVEQQAGLSQEARDRLEATSRNLAEITRTLGESRSALDEIGRTSQELDMRAAATVHALQGLETGLTDLERLSRSFRTTVQDFRIPAPFFPWTDDLSVGVPRMDDQHRVLLRLINRVADLGASGASGSAIRTILGQLVDYTRFHFGDEEKLMASRGYPDLPGHHKVHEAFVSEVVSLLERMGTGEQVDATSLLVILKDWLVRHIQGTDKKYGAYFARTDSASTKGV